MKFQVYFFEFLKLFTRSTEVGMKSERDGEMTGGLENESQKYFLVITRNIFLLHTDKTIKVP